MVCGGSDAILCWKIAKIWRETVSPRTDLKKISSFRSARSAISSNSKIAFLPAICAARASAWYSANWASKEINIRMKSDVALMSNVTAKKRTLKGNSTRSEQKRSQIAKV